MNEDTKILQQGLIRQASEMLGSEAALSRLLNIYPQILNRYSTGKRELPLTLYFKIEQLVNKDKKRK